jgi:hypothetical protein
MSRKFWVKPGIQGMKVGKTRTPPVSEKCGMRCCSEKDSRLANARARLESNSKSPDFTGAFAAVVRCTDSQAWFYQHYDFCTKLE